ncbi:MAG: nucleotidyl transferase AbiEii/AbiGii toxin family protein [Burkholderiales bacterium]
MITRIVIEERVREWGLVEEVVEKDYVLGWLLWGIGSEPTLASTWIFKGGTCLKKCFIETYRFSEDLDFTILPGGPIRAEDVRPFLDGILQKVHEQAGIDFGGREPLLRTHPSGEYTEGRVYYRGPRNTPSVASIKLDLSASEKLVRPPVIRKINHAFPDQLPAPASIRCCSFEEVFAEKIRAMGERGRPRDLFDIINLFRRSDLRSQPTLIREVLDDKCSSKGVPVPTFETIESASTRSELESEWANMLAHQLPALPPFDDFWNELRNLFAWLTGTIQEERLDAFVGVQEPLQAWTPPATAFVWGEGVPLEPVRFAAANQLCVELTYQNTIRLIEPYSLRRSRAGKLLLCAVKVETRESRTYRVDRIQALKVSTRPFTPVFRIEFSSTGQIYAPYLARPRLANPFPARAKPSLPRHGPVYIIRCNYCGREFRKRTMDFTLRPHKRGDRQCPSMHGSFVRTTYQ